MLATVGAIAVVWLRRDDWFTTSPPARLGSAPALARVELGDRQSFEILALGTEVFEEGVEHPNQTPGPVHLLRPSSTRVRVRSTADQPTHLRADFKPHELYLCLRAEAPLRAEAWNYQRGAFFNGRLERKALPEGSPVDDQATRLEAPPLLVQVSDGASGWMTANGPLIVPDPRVPYFWVVFESWPRSPKTLDFRFAVPGQDPQVVSLPNPGHVGAPVVTAAPGAREFATSSYRVSIQPQLRPVTDYARVLRLHANAYGERRYDGDVPFEVIATRLTGTFGGVIPQVGFEGLDPTIDGFPLAGDDRLVEAEVQVRAKPEVPRSFAEVTLIAEGRREADGSLRITRIYPQSGVHEIEDLGSPEIHRSGEVNFGIRLHSNSKGPVRFATGSAWWAYLFVDDETESSGRFSPPTISATTGLHSSFVGRIEPGQRFRIGLAPPPPPDTHRFVIDTSTP